MKKIALVIALGIVSIIFIFMTKLQFSNLSSLKVGFQRIDFLRLENNQLILLEIEDNSPIMNLELLENNFREKVLEEYKNNIYNYLEK